MAYIGLNIVYGQLQLACHLLAVETYFQKIELAI